MRKTLLMSPLVSIAILVAGALSSPVWGQEAAQQPEIRFESTELAPGLLMLEGVGGFAGGNVAVLTGSDGIVLIDDSFPPFSKLLLEAVAKAAAGPIDFVINTHVHGDHTGGNSMVAGTGATVVAHDNVRGRMIKDGIPAGNEMIPAPPEALPVITFADAMTFHLNGQEAYVFHVEHAHTDGDAVIHFREADVIHAGDVFFHQLFPFIDLDSGGSLDGYIAAQKKILAAAGPKTRIIPGHGALANAADLEASVAMLEDVKAIVAKLIAGGASVEDVIAAKPLQAYEAQSWAFISTERMIRQVYRSIKGE